MKTFQVNTENLIVGKIRNKNRTRNHLLFTAYREIYKEGYAGASLNDILKKTNISKGAIYHYFD